MAGKSPGGRSAGANKQRQRRARTQRLSGASATLMAVQPSCVWRKRSATCARSTVVSRYAKSATLIAIPSASRKRLNREATGWSEAQLGQHRVDGWRNRGRARRGLERGVGVFQAVPGEREHEGRARLEAPGLHRLDEASHGRRGRGLHEDAFLASEETIRVQDLLV